MINEKIKNILQLKLNCKKINIFNESNKHSALNSKNSHFKILVISDYFLNINLIDRHRKIYSLLLKYISKYKIKALSIHTYTILEWNNSKKKHKNFLNSPECKHKLSYK